jgi:hypothetical protein
VRRKKGKRKQNCGPLSLPQNAQQPKQQKRTGYAMRGIYNRRKTPIPSMPSTRRAPDTLGSGFQTGPKQQKKNGKGCARRMQSDDGRKRKRPDDGRKRKRPDDRRKRPDDRRKRPDDGRRKRPDDGRRKRPDDGRRKRPDNVRKRPDNVRKRPDNVRKRPDNVRKKQRP